MNRAPDPRTRELREAWSKLQVSVIRLRVAIGPRRIKGHPRDCGCYFCRRQS